VLKLNRSTDGRFEAALIVRMLRKNMPRYTCVVCWLALAVILAGCGSLFSSNSPPPGSPVAAGGTNAVREDPLRVGDRVKVELSGTADPVQPSDLEINADGTINLTHIGHVVAAGKSPSQLEKEIEAKYVPAWYPQITVTVTPTARFFYVLGQVNNAAGGRILYTGPITLLGAIGAAGDFTPFADKRHVTVIRALDGSVKTVNCIKAIKHPELDIPIYPGDKIQVGRRF
jgi:protein involved in polysaccharide export with SLBB domain